MARLLERYAKESGLSTVRARVGQEVVKLAIENQPVLILIDTELPGKLRGWQAIRELRQRPGSKIPVVTCCWGSQQEALEHIPEAVGHLQKPDIEYADFVMILKNAGIDMQGTTFSADQIDPLPL
jgi:CheY-like chemotaxis protein